MSDELEEHAAAFVREFPEVGDPEIARAVMELSREYAGRLGHPDLGNDYRFAKIVHAAKKYGEEHPPRRPPSSKLGEDIQRAAEQGRLRDEDDSEGSR